MNIKAYLIHYVQPCGQCFKCEYFDNEVCTTPCLKTYKNIEGIISN